MKYLIIPEGCRWTETEAQTPEGAYTGVCCWYNPGTRIAVINTATSEAAIFTRQLDSAGNLQEITRHL